MKLTRNIVISALCGVMYTLIGYELHIPTFVFFLAVLILNFRLNNID